MRTYKPMIYGDGSFGHQHVRERLATLVEEYDAEIAEKLRGAMSDDGWEEDEAIDILNANTSQEKYKCVWEFYEGDLFLSELVSENSGGK